MTSFAMNWTPILFPHSPENIQIAQGQIVSVKPDQLNRNVGIVMLSLWPAATRPFYTSNIRRKFVARMAPEAASVARTNAG